MRLLHTADWHLGRVLHGTALIADQAHLLDEFVRLARDERPDLVIIAGDVYDRAVPPVEAVALLDETLSRLVLDCGLRVVAVAGNHDSAARFAFGSRLLAARGLHLAGMSASPAAPLTIEDAHGPVSVYPFAFAEPAVVRAALGDDTLQGHDETLRALVADVTARWRPAARSIAVAHCFAAGSAESESERPLAVGGSGAVDPGIFAPFTYTALGHLHRPQALPGGRVSYSGSLMPYSFSEADHEKSVLAVEIDAGGGVTARGIALSPLRTLRRITGAFEEILRGASDGCDREDYLMVTLTDEAPVYDAMGRLRERYPNILHIERAGLVTADAAGARIDHRALTERDLFAAFYRQVAGKDLSAAESALFTEIVDGLGGPGGEEHP